ncbi:hypothetical protein EJ04DRAFT_609023 [Polyplosphaeria fusca]|uniref:Uncharacterized protein n=1 Tax=Polyplosphaeria fusca TaxID=682080 RepID=A0A9P4QW35_9PLEO|nr:hypothetical protein EJ04DRAFT_609023 [Polyplosphaeria fusca]
MTSGACHQLEPKSKHRISTLITGNRAALVFPPSEYNLRCLKESYQAAGTDSKGPRNYLEGINPLESDETINVGDTIIEPDDANEGSITTMASDDTIDDVEVDHEVNLSKAFDCRTLYLQYPGSTLIIPPLCPVIIVAQTTSVSADFYISLASKLPQRVQNLSLLRARNDRRATKDEVKAQNFTHRLFNDLEQVLLNSSSNTLPAFDTGSVITELAGLWDNAKEDICQFVGASVDKKMSNKIVGM